jgi:menaquinone-dependent protoporphyrinogen oxidase
MNSVTVLVAYASKRGSTREVAEAVAASLRDRGWAVDVRPASEVDDTTPYGAVVLGAAIYMGRLHKDARKLLKDHRGALVARTFAAFAMGPTTLSDEEVAGARRQLDKSLDQAGVVPDATAIFGGVIDPTKFKFPLNRLPAADARDWEAIHRWAGDVAAAIERHAVAAA